MAKSNKVLGKVLIGAAAVALVAIVIGFVGLLSLSTKTAVETEFFTVRFSYNKGLVSTQAVAKDGIAVDPYFVRSDVAHRGLDYKFAGWSLDGENVVNLAETKITGDTNFYAIFDFDGFIDKTWLGAPAKLDAQNIWQYNGKVYYSKGTTQYVLNGTLWQTMPWSGLDDFDGQNVWQYTDDSGYTHVYYSNGDTNQYRLDGTNWVAHTWDYGYNIYGKNIWQYDGKIYSSYYDGGNYTNQYVLNGNAWDDMNWSGVFTTIVVGRPISYFNGDCIWQHDGKVYYSNGDRQAVLDGTEWKNMTWQGADYLDAYSIWENNGEVYYSGQDQTHTGTKHYVLRGDTWEEITWDGNGFYGIGIWYYNGHTYYSYSFANTSVQGELLRDSFCPDKQ